MEHGSIEVLGISDEAAQAEIEKLAEILLEGFIYIIEREKEDRKSETSS